FARHKAVDEGVAERCDFRTGDVRRLPFDDATFDCVTCQGLLHHLEDLGPCLEELDRVLKPAGRCFISDPCRDDTAGKRGMLALRWRHRKGDLVFVYGRKPDPTATPP